MTQSLADQLALGLENARLFAAEARRRREAETLQTATQALSATLELHKVLESILEELQHVVPYDSASVQQLREGSLEIIGGHGFANPEQLLGMRFDLSRRRQPQSRGHAPARSGDHRRCSDHLPGVSERTTCPNPHPILVGRAAVVRGPVDRDDRARQARTQVLHPGTCAPGDGLCGAGSHRHRECAPVQRRTAKPPGAEEHPGHRHGPERRAGPGHAPGSDCERGSTGVSR